MIGFLLDLEGTLVKDKSYTPFPQALEFTEELEKLGIPWIVATNNSTDKPYQLVEILKSKGFNVNEKKLISPSLLASNFLRREGVKSIYFLGTEKIKEFFEEGNIMKHCVFSSNYYERENSIILSATVKGEKVETIEVSLNNLAVKQSRGLRNASTEYNKDIIKLVTNDLRKQMKIAMA